MIGQRQWGGPAGNLTEVFRLPNMAAAVSMVLAIRIRSCIPVEAPKEQNDCLVSHQENVWILGYTEEAWKVKVDPGWAHFAVGISAKWMLVLPIAPQQELLYDTHPPPSITFTVSVQSMDVPALCQSQVGYTKIRDETFKVVSLDSRRLRTSIFLRETPLAGSSLSQNGVGVNYCVTLARSETACPQRGKMGGCLSLSRWIIQLTFISHHSGGRKS